ncbi:hypothetical protein M2175_003850 [Bradyrhizobium elkanii]|nr:hypothetical protein [Bradyrhizobium elkanii]MCS3969373.1 hypothetical protein [Bradyrhizobium japonicum]
MSLLVLWSASRIAGVPVGKLIGASGEALDWGARK